MASAEFAQLFADELGWPPARTDVTVKDPVLGEMMAMSKNSTPYLTLVGFRWQTPTASSVLQAEIIDMVEGKIAPEKLAADIQAAVDTWFKPQAVKAATVAAAGVARQPPPVTRSSA